MEKDRELLKLAAKAAGIETWIAPEGSIRNVSRLHPSANALHAPVWNPFNDDGDALRLAVKLNMNVAVNFENTVAEPIEGHSALVKHGADSYAATRRAIVNAAAEIGKAMP